MDRDAVVGVQPIVEQPMRFGGYCRPRFGSRSEHEEKNRQRQLAAPVAVFSRSERDPIDCDSNSASDALSHWKGSGKRLY